MVDKRILKNTRVKNVTLCTCCFMLSIYLVDARGSSLDVIIIHVRKIEMTLIYIMGETSHMRNFMYRFMKYERSDF